MHSATRWFRRLFVLGVSVAALTMEPAIGLRRAAAEPVVTDDNSQRERARELYQRGADSYQNKRYPEALAAFEQGYSLTPLPGFLFNIAMTHRAMGQSEKAIASFQAYLKVNPTAADKPQVEAAIADERRKLAQAAGTPELRTGKANATSGQPALLTGKPETAGSEGAKKPFYKTWWFWTATGVAVTAVSVGIGVGLSQSRPTSYPEVMWQ